MVHHMVNILVVYHAENNTTCLAFRLKYLLAQILPSSFVMSCVTYYQWLTMHSLPSSHKSSQSAHLSKSLLNAGCGNAYFTTAKQINNVQYGVGILYLIRASQCTFKVSITSCSIIYSAQSVNLYWDNIRRIFSKYYWSIVLTGNTFKYRTSFVVCLTYYHRNFMLDYPCFLLGNLSQRITQEHGMVQAYIGNDRH